MEDNKKSSDGVNIKILGTGCPNCLQLEQNTKQALAELGLEAIVEKVTEISEIMSYGIMSTPALVINGEIKVYGRVAEIKEIKKLLTT